MADDLKNIMSGLIAASESITSYEKQKKRLEQMELTNPIINQLKDLVVQSQKQNEMLQHQIELLSEENERQKQEIIIARKNEENANKQANKAYKTSWIAIGVSIIAALATIIFGVISIFL